MSAMDGGGFCFCHALYRQWFFFYYLQILKDITIWPKIRHYGPDSEYYFNNFLYKYLIG